ncbi:MAG: hypothetical protein DMG60_03525 [Acidobacteria bacterium]|nr:MAG: hypothetical protein DMG60_03525 [Acidobacteriota bacterium]
MLASSVSDTSMHARIAVTLLLCTWLFGQSPRQKKETTFISRAKQAIISNFDPALPNLTMEAFLKYETGDKFIDWKDSECEDVRTKGARQFCDARCITAYSSLRDGRVITVILRVANDTAKPPKLISVTVIDKGLEDSVQLIQIPAVVQGNKVPGTSQKQWPRDFFPLSSVG